MSGRILVTGGAGFIGSHLTEALTSRGDHVVVLDSFDPFYDPEVKRRNLSRVREQGRCTVIEGDIRDPRTVSDAFARGPFTTVVHLAARAGVRPSIREPLIYQDVNVGGTIGILEALKKAPATHFVFGSSSSVYGATTEVPFSESASADRPSSPYASSKRSAEMIAYAYHHLYALPVTCLRFFTVYGPRQRPEMAIHKFARQIADGETIQIYGDGSSRRDYTFVDDIVDGIVRAIAHPAEYRVYNLGTRETTALLSLVAMLGERLGRTPRILHLEDQPGDVPVTYADVTRAEMELGYHAATSIADGLSRFVAWFRGHP